MLNKSFFDIFRRCDVQGEKRNLLLRAEGIDVRYCRDPFRVEVDMAFSTQQDHGLLYAIEDELCALYEARSFRIFPKYPSSLFSISSMPAVLAEAERIGAVTHGFFDEPRFSLEGTQLYIDLPFTDAGIDLLGLAKTDRIIEGIIRSRYDLSVQVKIRPAADAVERAERRRAEQERVMQEIDHQIREQAELQRRTAAHSQGESHADVDDERADFQHARSLLPPAAAPEITDNLLHIGTATFRLDEAELLLGSPFTVENPTPLSDVREARGVVDLSFSIW